MVRRKKGIVVGLSLLFSLLILSPLSSAETEIPPLSKEVESAVAHLPIQHNGRVKPFDSFARETLGLITGSATFGRGTPVETVLNIVAYPEKWENEPILSVPYHPLRQELGFSPKKSHISYNDLFAVAFMKRLPAIVQKQEANEKLTLLENETMELYFRFTSLHGLFTQELKLIPSENRRDVVWNTPSQPFEEFQNFLAAYRERDEGKMLQHLQTMSERIHTQYPLAMPEDWRLQLEVLYHRIDPLRLAWIFYGLSALLLSASLGRPFRRGHPVALTVFIIAMVLHAGGIVTRVVLAGRPPVSNFYESMLWLPFITVILGFVFELRSRATYFCLSAALFGGVTLLLSEHLPLDPSIQPIVAVLRSNKWLAIHVLTIVSSYGILTFATGIAHFYGGSFLFQKRDPLPLLGDTLYRVIQIGVIFLATGIMLGAVWANASWGRYWGWDPKETWALITLLWFLALLHARKASWIGGPGLAVGTILGFFLLLMTYYGVSFYLVGLHSYAGGSAKPIPPLLIAYLIAELMFVVGVVLSVFRRRRVA